MAGVAVPSRCLPKYLAASLLAAALFVPAAQAQVGFEPVVPAFTLAAQPSSVAVFPEQTATFEISVGNPAAVARNATMSLPPQLPAGWTWDFSRPVLDVPAQGSNTTLLFVFVPSGASPGAVTITYEVDDELSEPTRANVTVNVQERAPTAQGASVAPPPPLLTLSVSTGDAGESGDTVRGTLVVQNHDATRTARVQIAAIARDGWSPYVSETGRLRVILPGESRSVDVFVQVPPLAENTTKDLDIAVSTEGVTYTARWTVTGIAPQPAAPSEDAQPAPSAPGTTSSGSRTVARVNGPNLDVFVEPLELYIPSGGVETAIVRLHNTGTQPLTITLAGTPPPTWAAFTFLPAEPIALGPGERADVALTVQAPDVPPGGQTTARV
ncbi:MAG TPA: hypothetical protein VM582_03050, partial [Candidatus Thermoplasmatota archaeon]|nr:hypothetical protein [Candidatus Thermoplasmatota archaeon]